MQNGEKRCKMGLKSGEEGGAHKALGPAPEPTALHGGPGAVQQPDPQLREAVERAASGRGEADMV